MSNQYEAATQSPDFSLRVNAAAPIKEAGALAPPDRPSSPKSRLPIPHSP
ncbi:MAG: hypothetical protein RBJ76_16430 [Stenomitos frigidus ULC029]